MRRPRLGSIFALLLIAEIVVFILVGNWIGVGWTILLALATSAIGLWLFSREGVRALRALRSPSSSGKAPATAAVDTGLVALGGLLVLIPGFVSDLAGLLCLMPATRPLIRRLIMGGVARKMGPTRVRSRRVDGLEAPYGDRGPGAPGTSSSDRRAGGSSTAPDVIEGEIVP